MRQGEGKEEGERELKVATSAEHEIVGVVPAIDVSIESSRRKRSALARIAFLAAIIVVLAAIAYKLGWFNLRHATALIASLQSGHDHVSLAIIFFIIFATTTAVGFPALPFTVAAG